MKSSYSYKNIRISESASAHDILRDLGPISKEEVDYYEKLLPENEQVAS